MSVLRRRRDQLQEESQALDTAESGLGDNFAKDSPYHRRRIVPLVVAVSVVLAVSYWLVFEAYINVPAIMKEGRLSPDDPTSYARIGELSRK